MSESVELRSLLQYLATAEKNLAISCSRMMRFVARTLSLEAARTNNAEMNLVNMVVFLIFNNVVNRVLLSV